MENGDPREIQRQMLFRDVLVGNREVARMFGVIVRFAARLSGSLARAWPLFRPVEQCARFLSRFEQMRKRGAAGSEYLVTQREVGLNLCSCGMLRLAK